MKKFLFLSFLTTLTLFASAQRCLTDQYLEQNLATHPELKAEYDKFVSVKDIAPLSKTNGTRRIIPVVFHVIHEYGVENISKAQIDDQIRILNEDFNRLNADTTKTRSVFKGRAVSCDVEF